MLVKPLAARAWSGASHARRRLVASRREQLGQVSLRSKAELAHRSGARSRNRAHRKTKSVGNELDRMTHADVGEHLALSQGQGAGVTDLWVIASCDKKAPAVRVELLEERPAANYEALPEPEGFFFVRSRLAPSSVDRTRS